MGILSTTPFLGRLAGLALSAALLLPAAVGPAQAQMLCSKPIQPLCSTPGQGTGDLVARAQCRDDVRGYLSDLRTYRSCLDEARDEAERQLADADGFLTCLEKREDDCRLDVQRNY